MADDETSASPPRVRPDGTSPPSSSAAASSTHTPKDARKDSFCYLKSCGPCRTRKTKCNRVAPCSSCTIRGIQRLCYADVHSSLDVNLGAAQRPAKRARTQHQRRASTSPADSPRTSPLLPPLHPSHDECRNHGAKRSPPLLPDAVSWDRDLQPRLVETNDCRKLFHCFFSELDSLIACIHPLHVEDAWRQLHQEAGATRSAAALILAVAAITLLLAPRAHSAHRVKAAKRHRELFDVAVRNLQYEDEVPPPPPPSSTIVLERLQGLDLCCHYANMSDASSTPWYLISYTARLAKTIDLFVLIRVKRPTATAL